MDGSGKPEERLAAVLNQGLSKELAYQVRNFDWKPNKKRGKIEYSDRSISLFAYQVSLPTRSALVFNSENLPSAVLNFNFSKFARNSQDNSSGVICALSVGVCSGTSNLDRTPLMGIFGRLGNEFSEALGERISKIAPSTSIGGGSLFEVLNFSLNYSMIRNNKKEAIFPGHEALDFLYDSGVKVGNSNTTPGFETYRIPMMIADDISLYNEGNSNGGNDLSVYLKYDRCKLPKKSRQAQVRK
jgi:hypothetical protein